MLMLMLKQPRPSCAQRCALSSRRQLDSNSCLLLANFRLMIDLLDNSPVCREASLGDIVLVVGLSLGVTRMEWCALLLAMMLVWIAEALNTALEFLCNLVSPDFHPLIKKSKDVAAASVLISAAGAVVIGVLIFLPYLLTWG